MAGISNIEDLTIWQDGMNLCADVYKITKSLPNQEIYGLTSQIRRSAVSVPSNIAEGFGRRGKKEFKNFLSIARGSLFELKTQLLLTRKLELLLSEDINPLLNRIEVLGKQIGAFARGLR